MSSLRPSRTSAGSLVGPARRRRPVVRVRTATAEDRGALLALLQRVEAMHAALQPRFFRSPPGGEAAGERGEAIDRALAARDEVVFVAERAGAIEGMAHVRLFDTPRRATQVAVRRALLESLVVADEARRNGVGRALVEAAASWARLAAAEELLLTVWDGNEGAERFYDRLGFHAVSRVLGLSL